ncbi:MAG: replicative DNA helicase [Acholeplasmatales bacterium]|nr:replicative DNA helicase [Acholeplasmatales bacterium]
MANNKEVKLPQEIEAEIAILGSIFIDPRKIVVAMDLLDEDDFFDNRNKLIFKTMVSLSKEGKAIDGTTVIGRLNSNGELEISGGADYISSIAMYEYTSSHIETYIGLVSQASIRRKSIATLQKLVEQGFNPDVSTDNYIDNVESEVFEISKKKSVTGFETIGTVSERVFKNTESQSKRGNDVIGLDTGFEKLNKITQGFQPGQLIVLAARPGAGKSAMSLNLAFNIATRNNLDVAIFSLEMPSDQLVERLIASDASIALGSIKNGNLDKAAWLRFNTSIRKLSNVGLFFDDSPNTTISSIRAKCRNKKAEKGSKLGMVIIDYLQLIEDSSSKNTVERVTKITRGLKLMARELEVPVIALSQLSRDIEKQNAASKAQDVTKQAREPVLSDLRDSGSIEQDADIVMFIHRKDLRSPDTKLIVAKNRSGSNGDIPMLFTGEHQRFKEKTNEEE